MARGVKKEDKEVVINDSSKEDEAIVINDSSEVMAVDLLDFRAKMVELGEKLTTELIENRSRDVYQSCDMVIRLYQALNA